MYLAILKFESTGLHDGIIQITNDTTGIVMFKKL